MTTEEDCDDRNNRSAHVTRAVLIALVLCAAPAAAQEADPRPLTIDGVAGVWVPLEYAQRLERYRLEALLLGQQLTLAHEQLRLRGASAAALRAQVAEDAAAIAIRDGRILELDARVADLGVWWREPWFWAGVGLLVGVIVPLVIVVVVQ
ncbi:MAG: hypothetical protein ACRCU1_00395 [Alsobacter sp.]